MLGLIAVGGAALPHDRQEQAVIAGRVVRATGSDTVPVPGTRVVLHRLGPDAQGPVDSVAAGPDGGFRFRLARDTAVLYLVSARRHAIEYFSGAITLGKGGASPPVTVVVADTSSRGRITVSARYLVVGRPDTERRRTVVQLLVLRNQEVTTRVSGEGGGEGGGAPVWAGPLPPGAVRHRVADLGSEVAAEAVRFRGDTVEVLAPIAPGSRQLLLEHVFPASLDQLTVPLGAGEEGAGEAVQVVTEEMGAAVVAAGLAPAPPQVVDGQPLARWTGTARGGVLVVTFPRRGLGERGVVAALVTMVLAALGFGLWAGTRRRRVDRGGARGAAAALALLWIGACAAPPGTGRLVVLDDAGDTVRLDRPARRIVSLAPSVTEALFAIGAGRAVVGRTTWCDAPPEARAVASIGDGLEPNVEAVVARQPDLVVAYHSPSTDRAVARLRALGLPVLQLRTDRMDDLARALGLLGAVTGRVRQAARVRDQLNSALAVEDHRTDAGPLVVIVAWDQPPMVIGRGSFLHEIVVRAGARNAFADLAAASAPVSLEAVTARNPELVLTTAESPAFLRRPEWRVIPAVRAGRVVRITGTEFLRPSPRAPLAVRRLRAALDSLGY